MLINRFCGTTTEIDPRFEHRREQSRCGHQVLGRHAKLQLTVEHSTLQIEQACHEQKLDALETEVNQTKVELTDDDIQRRQLRDPLNGQVVELLVQPGE